MVVNLLQNKNNDDIAVRGWAKGAHPFTFFDLDVLELRHIGYENGVLGCLSSALIAFSRQSKKILLPNNNRAVIIYPRASNMNY